MKTPSMSRRDFVRLGVGAAVAGAAVKATLLEPAGLVAQTAGDGRKIRFVMIGTGIRGCDLLKSARMVPTGVCVGAADLYKTRHLSGIEAYGADFPTTSDYRTLLDRKDVDAVFCGHVRPPSQAGNAGRGCGRQGRSIARSRFRTAWLMGWRWWRQCRAGSGFSRQEASE